MNKTYETRASIEVYCKYPMDDHHAWRLSATEFRGETVEDCINEAKGQGWIFHDDKTTTCPQCAQDK